MFLQHMEWGFEKSYIFAVTRQHDELCGWEREIREPGEARTETWFADTAQNDTSLQMDYCLTCQPAKNHSGMRNMPGLGIVITKEPVTSLDYAIRRGVFSPESRVMTRGRGDVSEPVPYACHVVSAPHPTNCWPLKVVQAWQRRINTDVLGWVSRDQI